MICKHTVLEKGCYLFKAFHAIRNLRFAPKPTPSSLVIDSPDSNPFPQYWQVQPPKPPPVLRHVYLYTCTHVHLYLHIPESSFPKCSSYIQNIFANATHSAAIYRRLIHSLRCGFRYDSAPTYFSIACGRGIAAQVGPTSHRRTKRKDETLQ